VKWRRPSIILRRIQRKEKKTLTPIKTTAFSKLMINNQGLIVIEIVSKPKETHKFTNKESQR